MARDKDLPLFPSSVFEYENRPKRDVAFTYVYLLSLLASFVGGIYAYSNRNLDYNKLTSKDHISKASSCPAPSGRRLLQERLSSDDYDIPQLMIMATVWIIASFIGFTLFGCFFIHQLRTKTAAIINFTVAVQVAMPLFAGIAAIAKGALVPGIILLVFAAFTALVFYMWRDQLPLVARLISVAAQGLNDNPALIWIVTGLQISLFAISIPIVVSMFAAQMNGQLVYNPARVASRIGECVNESGQAVPCCAWQVDTWVIPYVAFAAVTLLWTTFLSFQIKVYSTAGTIAQWYFAPVNVQSFKGNAMRSLKHALGPSFGSLCLGSGILTLCDLLRNATENARRENQRSFAACIMACIMDCIASIIEYITKFATIKAAISGEAFIAAGRSVVGLLKRNLLSAVGVWWLPPMVLNCFAFTVSLVWGTIVGLVSFAAWHVRDQAIGAGVILGLVSFILCLVVLAFFTSLLLNIVDVVFICFAMDREQQAFTKPVVHEVFSQIPNVGPIVQNPGGEVNYGAPAVGTGEMYYQPPSQQDAQVHRV